MRSCGGNRHSSPHGVRRDTGSGVELRLVTAMNLWQFIASPLIGPAVITAGTISSLLGGLIPARRAASVSPLEAMRS